MDSDLQTTVEGLCAIEFVPVDAEDEFLEQINEFVDEKPGITSLVTANSTHPRAAQFRAGASKEIQLPEEYQSIFDTVTLQQKAETNELVRITLYARVDDELFKQHRAEREAEIDDTLDIKNAGIYVLRDAETNLTEFLKTEIQAGLFSSHHDEWTTSNQNGVSHPTVWSYDLTDTAIDSKQDLKVDSGHPARYLELGNSDEIESQFTEFADGRALLNVSEGNYYQCQLGFLPFRYVILRLERNDVGELRYMDSNPTIPRDARTGIGTVGRAFTGLCWSLYTYFELFQYEPDAVLSEFFDVDSELDLDEALRDSSDETKSELIDCLYDTMDDLDEFWIMAAGQFESTRSIDAYLSSFDETGESVMSLIRTHSEDIEALSEDRTERYTSRYTRTIDRIESSFETSIELTGTKVSNSVLILAIVSLFVGIADLGFIPPSIVVFASLIAITAIFAYLDIP